MIIHNGVKYTDKELAVIAGISEKGIQNRRYIHPEWGFEELTQARKKKETRNASVYFLDWNGKPTGVRNTAKVFYYSEKMLYHLYDSGIRTFQQIQEHYKNHIGESDGTTRSVDFSRIDPEDVRFYEKFSHGQEDSALIVCELCGIHGMYAKEFKEYFKEVFG